MATVFVTVFIYCIYFIISCCELHCQSLIFSISLPHPVLSLVCHSIGFIFLRTASDLNHNMIRKTGHGHRRRMDESHLYTYLIPAVCRDHTYFSVLYFYRIFLTVCSTDGKLVRLFYCTQIYRSYYRSILVYSGISSVFRNGFLPAHNYCQ